MHATHAYTRDVSHCAITSLCTLHVLILGMSPTVPLPAYARYTSLYKECLPLFQYQPMHATRAYTRDVSHCSITCGMMVSRERRSWSPRVAMSTPSIVILPPARSRIRNKARAKDDLPAPVRPTMPTCWGIIRTIYKFYSFTSCFFW